MSHTDKALCWYSVKGVSFWEWKKASYEDANLEKLPFSVWTSHGWHDSGSIILRVTFLQHEGIRLSELEIRMRLLLPANDFWGFHLLLQVRNITVSHTFKIDKARQELGYCPQPYSLADSVEHYLKIRQSRDTPISLSLPSVRQLAERGVLLLLMGLGLVLLIIYGILS